MYLILTNFLADGIYMTPIRLNWHERLRLKLARWLFVSVKKPDKLEVWTETS